MIKKIAVILTLILVISINEKVYSQTEISGNITTNSDWRLQYSPYTFIGDAAIAPDITLTIQPGVVIEGNGFKLDVFGDFVAVGSEFSAIEINDLNIKVNDPTSDPYFPTVTIDYCVVDSGSILNSNDPGVLYLVHSTVKSIPVINLWNAPMNCYIISNKFINSGGITSVIWGTHISIHDNLFYNWTGDYAVQNQGSYDDAQTEVYNNTFYNTDKIAVRLPADLTDTKLSAIENYWYTTEDSEIQAMIYDKVDDLSAGDYIPYLPFLHHPTSETPLHSEFEADMNEGLAPLNVNFTNLGAGYLREFLWDFGDGNTSELENPEHIYSSPGDYTVSLTVGDFLKSDTKVYSNMINVGAPPVAAFSVNKTEACLDDDVVFTDESTGNITSRKWFVNGTNFSDSDVFNWSLYQLGTYDIELVVFNEYTSDTLLKEAYVTAYQIPSNDFDVVNMVCGLNIVDVSYLGNASDQSSYIWDFDGAVIVSGSGQGPFELEWDAYGDKIISLDVSENSCFSPTTATSTVSVREIPVASFTSGTEICNNNPLDISFTGSASGEAIYSWDLDGASYIGDYPSGEFQIMFPSGGIKNISLSIRDNECVSELTNAAVDVVYPYDNQEICMVTIDTETGYNMIVWERTDDLTIDYYKIFREGTTTNQYWEIGDIDYEDISIFVDETAENSKQTYRYKIGLVDTCGNFSGLSGYHEPIFLQYTGSADGVNLEWGTYKIEDQEVSFQSYVIFRGSDSTKLEELATISGNFNRYTDNSDEAFTTKYFYRVGGLLDESCSPADIFYGKKADSGPFIHSFSNLEDNRIKTGVNPVSRPRLSVYPNPSSDFIQVKIPEAIGKFNCKLISITGQTVRETVLYTNFWKIEKNNLPSGLYFIEIDGKNSYFRKIIFE